MLKQILSVGGWTLVSRITGFVRDVVIAAVMGTGPVADAFVVALRLPNHFRAIFGEGAFNSAFVPTYARGPRDERAAAAKLFADRDLHPDADRAARRCSRRRSSACRWVVRAARARLLGGPGRSSRSR